LHEPPLQFELAAGTYGDVLHWLERGFVDLALLTPGVFAESLRDYEAFRHGPGYDYLVTVGFPPAQTPWAADDRRRAGSQFEYRSVCLVAADSPVRTIGDLQREAGNDNLQYLFVHPYSMSGRIAPQLALRRAGILPDRPHISYTYSDLETIRLLKGNSGSKTRVGFVADDALQDSPELLQGIRKLDFPQLDQMDLPQQVLATIRGFRFRDSLRAVLEQYEDPVTQRTFRHLSNWQELYGRAGQWCEELQISSLTQGTQNITLAELGEMLLQSARTHGQPPRIALVLSGGGAKCAYQVGVVGAIEEELAELTKANPQTPLEISLVAGTSGGAINSLPIALGITSTGAGRADFEAVWKGLDQRRIICPTWLVRLNVGLWFAVVQIVLVLVITRLLVRVARRRGWVDGLALLVLAGLNAAAAAVPFIPWSWFGTDHLWHHLWTWIGFGLWWSCGTLAVGGLLLLAIQRSLRRRGLFWPGVDPRTAIMLGFLLLGLPMLQVPTVLLGSRTLSGGQGIENALATDIPRLIEAHLRRQNKPGLRLDAVPANDRRLHEVSSQIIRRRLLTRDLVVTGDCLTKTELSLPNDLYFYAAADADSPPPPFGDRGVNLAGHPEILLDAVMGSGTIFPIFPARTLHDFPQPGQQVELIDGGFAHNSPIEAAVLWGATHIILIEASPTERVAMRNLAENAAAAFSHLHHQTQSVDLRSKRQVVVFTMTPKPPHLCVLDFADNLTDAAIRRGYLDARGYRDQNDPTLPAQPTFRKELGEPVFAAIAAEASSP
jgi:predicted acylesterase/phospholipase RssA